MENGTENGLVEDLTVICLSNIICFPDMFVRKCLTKLIYQSVCNKIIYASHLRTLF